MKKRLFLTGPGGCGKSTAILTALGGKLSMAGGFRTVRKFDETGQDVSYCLQSPGAESGVVFLDHSVHPSQVFLDVFSHTGVQLLQDSNHSPFLLLDEIGGIELLRPDFVQALEAALQSGIPCIGVMKAPGMASKMIRRLDMEHDFYAAAEKLRSWMIRDQDTLLLECGMYDPKALEAAKLWVHTYT